MTNAHGSLDSPGHGIVNGWAFDPDRPDTRCAVEVLIDGKPFLTVVADRYRSDLLAAGFGDGAHSFSLVLPPELVDGAPHALEAKIAGTKTALQHSPRIQVFSKALAQPAPGAVTLPDSLLGGLSVVIATKNNREQLERTLQACAAAARNLPVEFLVVDYGPESGAPLPDIPGLRKLHVTAASPGAARNYGVQAAARELILFLGDDVTPNVPTFFEQHINAHHMMPDKNIAVLGKITWPNLPDERVSFFMSHLQGAGEQQFGFQSLVPYTWLDWRYFYPENISFKKSIAADWNTGGYRSNLTERNLLEDAELAFRLDRGSPGGLQILYYPGAPVAHENAYSVRQFIERQLAAGLSARALFSDHAAAREKLGVQKLDDLLALPKSGRAASVDDLLRVTEGAKSWGVVIESNYRLGSQNWHADLLNAIFELSYLQGYVMGCPNREANYAAAYQYCIERFQEKLSTAAAFEVFGRFPSFTVT